MLQSFLSCLARRPFAWGECDCSLIIADWWCLNHGVDPAAHLRGTYASEAECDALLAREGGRLALVAKLAASVGAVRTDCPRSGDFGIVAAGEIEDLPAIMAPDGKWAAKSLKGLIALTPERVVAAWSISRGI
jgi:hypothetical protein